MIWIGSYLIKDEEGLAQGFATAVKAENISVAVHNIEDFARKEHPGTESIMVTDVGIADSDAAPNVGHSWIDPLAEDYWPEEEEAS